MLHHQDGDSHLYLDDALAPLYVATWVGPATLDLVERFQAWTDELGAVQVGQGQPLILINDGTAAGRPSGEVRRAFAEHTVVGDVRTYAVINSPMVRGAMTAIGWLVGDSFDVVSCKTLAEAFARASEYARERGLTPPPEPKMQAYRAG